MVNGYIVSARCQKIAVEIMKKYKENCKFSTDGKCFINDITDKWRCPGVGIDAKHCADYGPKTANDSILKMEKEIDRKRKLLEEALGQLKNVEWEVNIGTIARIEEELKL